VLFDVMHLAGQDLTPLPYVRRRGLLEELGLDGAHWSTPTALVGHGEQALRATREHGLEGLVCKRLDSVYEPGVRSRAWIKIRNMRSEDVVVGGWLPGKGRLSGLPGAVLVGQRAAGGLRFVGRVGTGWGEAERTELAGLLRAAGTTVCPFDPVPAVPGARWVVPRLVGEVRYSTRAGPVCSASRPGCACGPTWPPRTRRPICRTTWADIHPVTENTQWRHRSGGLTYGPLDHPARPITSRPWDQPG